MCSRMDPRSCFASRFDATVLIEPRLLGAHLTSIESQTGLVPWCWVSQFGAPLLLIDHNSTSRNSAHVAHREVFILSIFPILTSFLFQPQRSTHPEYMMGATRSFFQQFMRLLIPTSFLLCGGSRAQGNGIPLSKSTSPPTFYPSISQTFDGLLSPSPSRSIVTDIATVQVDTRLVSVDVTILCTHFVTRNITVSTTSIDDINKNVTCRTITNPRTVSNTATFLTKSSNTRAADRLTSRTPNSTVGKTIMTIKTITVPGTKTSSSARLAPNLQTVQQPQQVDRKPQTRRTNGLISTSRTKHVQECTRVTQTHMV